SKICRSRATRSWGRSHESLRQRQPSGPPASRGAAQASARAGAERLNRRGGRHLLGMVKERLIEPGMLVKLQAIHGLHEVGVQYREVKIGGLITLNVLARDPLIRSRYAALAEAAESVGTPQIRNVGTLAGNVCQRPWCWYFRNGFPCFKNGGTHCFAATG